MKYNKIENIQKFYNKTLKLIFLIKIIDLNKTSIN